VEPRVTEHDADAFQRPDGVDDGFAPRPDEPVEYTPPPPTVSPEEQATYQRPPGAEPFAPLPGERIEPHTTAPPPVPQAMSQAFGAPAGVAAGFDPAPGTRLAPSGPAPESPWWKPDAASDPWRDPAAAYWLGRGAVFPGGQPAQLAPEEDQEQDEAPVPPAEDATEEKASGRRGIGRVGLRAITLFVIVGLLAGAVGGGIGYWLTNRSDDVLHRSDVSLGKTGKPANRPPGSVADIAKRVGPAVVSIQVTTQEGSDVGAGVVIDKHGYVLTNNHVVASAGGGQGTVIVTFADEATAKAQIVGLDPVSDLAVLKVPTDELTVAALGDSDALAVGDPVIAIGSPLALQGTVTSGIVSALHRPFHPNDENGLPGAAVIDAVQTDAAINVGNSGGALVDASGAVIGINFAAAFGVTDPNGRLIPASGLGFAIPINYARSIAEQLIRSGKAVHATIGAQGKAVSAGNGLHEGAYLEQISPGGPAAKAGLKPGDVVVAAGGRAVGSFDELVVIVQNHKPGDKLAVTFYRGSAKQTATVTLSSD
jgi:S1-C subfamily serine protease